jgi:hypothetical protein
MVYTDNLAIEGITLAQLAAGPTTKQLAAAPRVSYYVIGASPPVYYEIDPVNKVFTQLQAGTPAFSRGRLVGLFGGSVTARTSRQRSTSANGVVATPILDASGNATGYTVTVTTSNNHNALTGNKVLMSCENADAIALSSGGTIGSLVATGGIATFDNNYFYGTITVTGNKTFTMSFPGETLPATGGYSGTSTQSWTVSFQEHMTPNGILTEVTRRLGRHLRLGANFATGSNNTMNLRERLPLVIKHILLGTVHEIRGSFGLGNTLIYASNHGWTVAQAVAQAVFDVTAMVQQIAAAGGSSTIEMPAPQTNTTGADTTGLRALYEGVRAVANVPANKCRITEDFSIIVDPNSGIGKSRFYRVGDQTHPSNQGVVALSYAIAQQEAPFYTVGAEVAITSIYDNLKSDSGSTQLCDGMWAGENTIAASGLSVKNSGNVHPIVTAISTTGNASRSMTWSYWPRADGVGYDLVCEIVAAAASDTFSIQIGNPSPRQFSATVVQGAKYVPYIDATVVTRTGTLAEASCYFGMTADFGADTGRTGYLSTDRILDGTNNEGAFSQPVKMGQALPGITIPTGWTNCTNMGFTLFLQANSAGTFYIRFGRPTLRQVA